MKNYSWVWFCPICNSVYEKGIIDCYICRSKEAEDFKKQMSSPVVNNKDEDMKPFDLDKAMAGEKVVDNTGSIAVDFKFWEKLNSIEFLFERRDGYLYCMKYSIEGSFNGLFMAPTKKKGWVNLYKSKHDLPTTSRDIYSSKEKAKQWAEG